MEKEFIPYELALRLKGLGFDERCFRYESVKKICENQAQPGGCQLPNVHCAYPGCTIDSSVESLPIPVWQQAFKWFREKNFHVNIESYHCLGKNKPFGLSIDYLHESGKWDYVDYRDDEDFETYEEAQKRAIEIIIELLERKK
jgi:hypothetical protein